MRAFLLSILAAAVAAAQTTVCFSPGNNCQQVILTELAKARTSVRVQAYNFTDATITHGLITLKQRGIDVAVILDRSWHRTAPNAELALTSARIPVLIDTKHSTAHNKVMIIDNAEVITGSYNFTWSANYANAENLLVLTDPAIVQRYAENWQLHAAHSVHP